MVLQTLWTHTDSSQMKICPLTHLDQVYLPHKEGATLQMFTSTVRLQYKFKVVKYTNDICIPLTVVQGTAIITQRYNQPFQYS